MSFLLVGGKFQAFDDEGDPLSGGLLYTYEPGTSTPKATYSDKALTTPNANPVVLDDRGEASVHLLDATKIVLKTSAGVTIWTVDDVLGFDQYDDRYAPFANRAAAEAATISSSQNYLSYISTNGDYLVEFVRDAIGEALTTADGAKWSPAKEVTPLHFGADADNSNDDATAINDMIDWIEGLTYRNIYEAVFPRGIYRVTSTISATGNFLRFRGMGRGRNPDTPTYPDGVSIIVWDGADTVTGTGVFTFGTAGDQARGVQIQDMSIFCDGKIDGIYCIGANLARFERLYIDQPKTGIVLQDTSYSTYIHGVEVWEPSLGGIDLQENCHSVVVNSCQFNGDSSGSETPSFGLRVGRNGNCSIVLVTGCSFDLYRAAKQVDWYSDCKGAAFVGNYIEVKGDGVSDSCFVARGGSGIIFGNRFTATDTPIATTVLYGVDLYATAHDWSIKGNFFSGFDTSAIRIASGATNIETGPNELNGGLTAVTNQNAGGSKSSVEIDSGDVIVETIDADTVTADKIVTPCNGTALVVASGEITVTGSYHKVDTESEAATDDLNTINGGTDGQIIVLQSYASARDTTLKDGTDNLDLAGDFTLTAGRDKIMLIYNGSDSRWQEISRSSN